MMRRRDFLRAGVFTGAAALVPELAKAEKASGTDLIVADFELEETTIAGLQRDMVSGKRTAQSITRDYLERIEDMKSRGFEKAGLYDPLGVGGTHVMYVLHHADQPSLYAGLPNEPKISPMVSLWKGVAKPLAMFALGAAALGGLFHYITKGPNEVSKELEDEMEREDQKAKEA